jgi:hypothetical protein
VSAPPVTGFSAVELPCHWDARGLLMPLHFSDLPFRPDRVFAVTKVPGGTRRGEHGHREQHQILACAAGRVEVELRGPDAEAITTTLQPGDALLVEPGVWTAQTFESPDTVLVVLSSGPYDPAELFHEPPDA